MSVFGKLDLEREIQVDDKTRLDATQTFKSKDEPNIILVEINPEDGVESFIDVTGTSSRDWLLDWQYDGISRDVTVSLRVTTDGNPPVTFSDTLEVLTAADDLLLSSDKDLTALESDILKYLPNGRSSFLNVHRKARDIILSEIDERGIVNADGSRITKDQLVEVEDFNKWSTYKTLWLIFQNLSNATDDVFSIKSSFYLGRMNFHRERAFIRIDFNRDGNVSSGEHEPVRSSFLIRR